MSCCNPGVRPARFRPDLFLAQVFIGLFVLLSISTNRAVADNAIVSEEEIKAAFIYNFTKFIEWPEKAFASESTPISVAVVGNDQFAEKLAALLKDKRAQGRTFNVRKVSPGPDITNCHVLFIAQSQTRRFSQYAEFLAKAPVLTVGEFGNFLTQGGIIN